MRVKLSVQAIFPSHISALVHSKDCHGNTPLHYAVQCPRDNMEELSEELIEHGAGEGGYQEEVPLTIDRVLPGLKS